MERYIYAVMCERNSELGKDWYVLNPVYTDADSAKETMDKCNRDYSLITTVKGITYNCKYYMEKIKVSGSDWHIESE